MGFEPYAQCDHHMKYNNHSQPLAILNWRNHREIREILLVVKNLSLNWERDSKELIEKEFHKRILQEQLSLGADWRVQH